MPHSRNVKYNVKNRIAEISLQRPPVNALSIEMIEDVLLYLNLAFRDAEVRAVLISSSVADRFCGGLDLDLQYDLPSELVPKAVRLLYIELFEAQFRLGKPSIAAVNGAARGAGMTLAFSCDVVLASDNATFGYPEINVGLLPGIHFIHLPQIVGRQRAFELLFSGRSFSAVEAQSMGLIGRVVPASSLTDEARALAIDFSGKSPTVMELGRAAFMQINNDCYRRSIEIVVDTFNAVAQTHDAGEGMRAFKERRKPHWRREEPPRDQ